MSGSLYHSATSIRFVVSNSLHVHVDVYGVRYVNNPLNLLKYWIQLKRVDHCINLKAVLRLDY
jgi:hypothetical protein